MLQGYKQYFIVIRNYKQYFIVIGSKAKGQWLKPVVSALEKLKQESCEFKASLSYSVRLDSRLLYSSLCGSRWL